MFQTIIQWIRKAARRLLSRQKIIEVMEAAPQISSQMAAAIELWGALYAGRMPWLFGSDGSRDETMQTLGLPATIASKLAKLVTLELSIELTGGPRADYLAEQVKPVMDRIRIYVEQACALGGLVFKPYIDKDGISIDIVQADMFYPTAFNGRGEINGAVFAEQFTQGKYCYTRLENHEVREDGYHIANHAYRSETKNELGSEVPLDSVEVWSDLQPKTVISGVRCPLFSYFRIPQANLIDRSSPLGVSVFSRAIGQIQETDKMYSGILWEYEGAQLAVDADVSALLPEEGQRETMEMPERHRRLFRNLGLSGGPTGDFYQVFSPSIRDASLYNGLNKQLQQVELACGLSFGTLSDPQNVDKTATEIKASKQEMYATVTDIQKALHHALDQLIYAVDVWATLGGLATAGAYHVTVSFDDSIINDPDVQKQQDLQEVRDRIMSKAEYRVKWYGETEETAQRKVREAQDSVGQGFFEE